MAGAIMGILAAGGVSLVVSPEVPCLSVSKVAERLEAAGVTVVPPPSRRLAVTVKKTNDRLSVEGVRAGVPFARFIPFDTTACASVERALVVIIASWSKQLPAAPPVPRAPSPRLEAVSVEVEVPPEEPAPVPEPVETPVESAPAPPPVVTPELEVRSPLATPPGPVVDVVPRSPVVVDAALLGGAAIGPTTTPTMAAQLAVGVGVERLSGVLEAGFQSAHASEVGQTRVEASLQWASLLARVRFRPTEVIGLEASLGPRVWRLSAVSSGPDASTAVAGFGGVVALGGSFRIAGPVSVHARWYGSLRSQIDRFVVANVGPVLELQPWETGLLLGLEVRLFGFHEAP